MRPTDRLERETGLAKAAYLAVHLRVALRRGQGGGRPVAEPRGRDVLAEDDGVVQPALAGVAEEADVADDLAEGGWCARAPPSPWRR